MNLHKLLLGVCSVIIAADLFLCGYTLGKNEDPDKFMEKVTQRADEPRFVKSAQILKEVWEQASIEDSVIESEVSAENPFIYYEDYQTMWVNAWQLNYRTEPSTLSPDTVIGKLDRGVALDVIGITTDGTWTIFEVDGVQYFVSSEYLTSEEIIVNTVLSGEGDSLTSRIGKVVGPSGNETYYNLDMTGCINRMYRLGYSGDYWVREDGVKMFGQYIMVAADFNIRPLGTIVESSLGTAIVVDTGEFALTDPTRLDVAVTW